MTPNEQNVIKIVKKVHESVVNITTKQVMLDVLFQPVPVAGQGSGFVLDDEGHILTNAHVVANVDDSGVVLTNGEKLKGKVVGFDQQSELALLKVNTKSLPPVKMADSDKVQVGQTAVAIGNPYGLEGGPSVTVGVVSAKERTIHTEQSFLEGLLQTDAPINPGNSGGPLVDSKGDVIGINTAIIPFAQSLGFAVPINAAKRVLGDLIDHGRVIRPWLGIAGLEINKAVADQYELSVKQGVLVVRVFPKTSADKAKILPGDIITKVEGKKIAGMSELQAGLLKKSVGDTAEIEFQRNGKKKTATVKLLEKKKK